MCGRFVLHGPVSRLESHFDLPWSEPFADRFNIAPQSPIVIIRENRVDKFNKREIALVQWGLVPSWAKASPLPSMHNARAETVHEKASFRYPFSRRRCLIPASGYFEWQSSALGGIKAKQPFYISNKDGSPMAMAAIWEHWQGADGSELQSAAVLTQAALGDLEKVHERMPMWVTPDTWSAWLDPQASVKDARDLLETLQEPLLLGKLISSFDVRAVSKAVNSGSAQGAELLRPIN